VGRRDGYEKPVKIALNFVKLIKNSLQFMGNAFRFPLRYILVVIC
jgi:hypothetical protein